MKTNEAVREVLKEFNQQQGQLIDRINNLPAVKRLREILYDGDDGFDVYCRYISPTEFVFLTIKDSLTGSVYDHVGLADLDDVLAMYDSGVEIFKAISTVKHTKKATTVEGTGVSIEEVFGKPQSQPQSQTPTPNDAF